MNVQPCPNCGAQLVWGVVAGIPVELDPKPYHAAVGRAWVFRRKAGKYEVLDVRGLTTKPNSVHAQHLCPKWKGRRG